LHIQELSKEIKLKLRFYLRNKACFSFEARRRLVSATFMPLLDYGDILYMNASAQCLVSIDTLYHGTLRFILNSKTLTHHCTLYTMVGWPSLVTRRLSHWYTFFIKPFWVYYLFIWPFLLFRKGLLCTLCHRLVTPLHNIFKLEELVLIGVFLHLLFNQIGQLRTCSHLQMRPGQDKAKQCDTAL
jgi:hypothetical protein